ncbi:MAG TPA: hypothetical protein VFV81_03565, partial [Verrucomicrobiae bacterium]|nr:hypothetical protein [Verrucomicrobiae bacterium]
VLTSVPVNDSTAVRYLRYLGPANGSCNVSIINFHGSRSGLALPSAPANISAATPSYKEVSLSWSASAGATSYTVKRATNSAGPYLVMENLPGNDLTALNSNTNWSDSSAVANTTYYYVIAALNDAGETDSAQTTVTTPAMVVPAGLAAIPGDTQVTLSWAGTGAPSYNVNRATVSGGPFTTITNVTGNGFADIGVSNGMTYYYVVCAVDGGSQSANSAEVRAVPAVQTAISINFAGGSSNNGYPSPMASTEKAGVTASANWNNASGASGTAASLAQDDGTATTAAVSWSANNTWSTPITERPGNDRMMKGYLDTSATSTTTVTVSNLPSAYTSGGYNVYVYCDGDNGSSTKTGIYTMGGMTIDSLDQGGANFAGTFIEASNSAGNFLVFPNQAAAGFTLSAQGLSTDSGPRGPINAIQIVALPAASSAPASPTALNAAGGNAVVNLGWTQSVSPGITGNNVYRSTSGSGGPYNLLANLAATTSYSDTAVGAGSTYYYSVTAINGNGESAPSAYAGAITIPAAPTGLGATAGNNQVALSWTASTGASSYNVKRSIVSGGPYTTLTNVTGTSFTDTTAVNGTTYYYVVSALNNSGESGDSTQAGATPSGPAAPAAPTGLKATAQKQAGKIKLAWTQSTSANVTTNNVYEATVSGGPYSRIASIAATTNYLASGLVSGTTYYYVVTAVNSSGLESPDSNQASATAK